MVKEERSKSEKKQASSKKYRKVYECLDDKQKKDEMSNLISIHKEKLRESKREITDLFKNASKMKLK